VNTNDHHTPALTLRYTGEEFKQPSLATRHKFESTVVAFESDMGSKSRDQTIKRDSLLSINSHNENL
jgi:hypothetical protein